jgi:hypothetical protein
LLYNIKDKGGKPDREPYLLPYGLRNPYRNLKSENSQGDAQKLYIHEFGFSIDILYRVQYIMYMANFKLLKKV